MLSLLFANPGEDVVVSSLGGAPEVKQHLMEMGFNVGSKISVVSKVDSGVIVKVKEARVALDRGMASKIKI